LHLRINIHDQGSYLSWQWQESSLSGKIKVWLKKLNIIGEQLMKKGNMIKGNLLLDFIHGLEGFTLWTGNKKIEDLAVVQPEKWYYVSRWGTEIYLMEMDFVDSPDELRDQLLIYSR
jgi:hypothetical protein